MFGISREAGSPTTPDEQLREVALDDGGYDELAHDEFVVHADDVFAGRAGISWRRVYPARRQFTGFGKQHQRRWSQ